MSGEDLSNQSEAQIFQPPKEFSQNARIGSMEAYKEMYDRSLSDPEGFWAEMAQDLEWIAPWDKVLEYDFNDAVIKWFEGGKINVSANCLDRHLKTGLKNKAAIIWQGEADEETRIYTYQTLHREVCRLANVLKSKGVVKGDRITLYMPMIPELAISMLACSRIGVIHNVVFGGFSSDALAERIGASDSKLVITADGGFRAGKVVALKANVDTALTSCPNVEGLIVVRRTGSDVEMVSGRDTWYHDEINAEGITANCEPEVMDAEDPLFILYTSGSTGKPKGVLHTTAGYLLYTLKTFEYIFDYKNEDTFWCTADIGWVTGHSYIVYGPLAAGATTLMFEGVPTYPNPDRFWQIVEKFAVNIFYTAPTAIRAVAKEGDKWPEGRDLSSLRLLGTVGEPINPEAWLWYYKLIGKEKCPIVDTWWQTETGGILVSALPGAMPLKPGSASLPFFGVKPNILTEDGVPVTDGSGGYLVIEGPWPGIMREVYKQPDRFKETYFAKFPGLYFTGDGARQDEDGYLWVVGRIDDVINVSGHRLGTAEIEDVLVSLSEVAEAAVVGFDHEIKGQSIYAFVTVNSGVQADDELRKKAVKHVRSIIGPFAAPEKLQFTDELPKTRSGKIMRRLLKKIASGKLDEMGDTSTLANPAVVDMLVDGKV